MVRFAGAPAAPDPASIYQGLGILLVETDGAKFPNGDPWKCVTCGVPAQNTVGTNSAWDYPQSFHDGKRILAGTNIIDCSPFRLADTECTAERARIYPIRGKFGQMVLAREEASVNCACTRTIFISDLTPFPFHEANLINSDILAVFNSTRRPNPVNPWLPVTN